MSCCARNATAESVEAPHCPAARAGRRTVRVLANIRHCIDFVTVRFDDVTNQPLQSHPGMTARTSVDLSGNLVLRSKLVHALYN